MLKQTVLVVLMGSSSVVFAGGFQVKVGASVLAPQSSDNGTVAGAKANVSNEIGFTPSMEYFIGESPISVELLLATPFKHDVSLDGLGKVATFKHLPPTLTFKYNFANDSKFNPYVGVGATVALPFSEKTQGAIAGTTLDADTTYGVAGQVGFTYKPEIQKNWGVFVDVRYAQVESDLKLNGAPIGTLEVNPWIYSFGYSYRF